MRVITYANPAKRRRKASRKSRKKSRKVSVRRNPFTAKRRRTSRRVRVRRNPMGLSKLGGSVVNKDTLLIAGGAIAAAALVGAVAGMKNLPGVKKDGVLEADYASGKNTTLMDALYKGGVPIVAGIVTATAIRNPIAKNLGIGMAVTGFVNIVGTVTAEMTKDKAPATTQPAGAYVNARGGIVPASRTRVVGEYIPAANMAPVGFTPRAFATTGRPGNL